MPDEDNHMSVLVDYSCYPNVTSEFSKVIDVGTRGKSLGDDGDDVFFGISSDFVQIRFTLQLSSELQGSGVSAEHS